MVLSSSSVSSSFNDQTGGGWRSLGTSLGVSPLLLAPAPCFLMAFHIGVACFGLMLKSLGFTFVWDQIGCNVLCEREFEEDPFSVSDEEASSSSIK